mmetsp:Transcript_18739/g.44029  ORF Transcript_18739/g.44029 Transcript_18739/m.44029 type:complete len:231 (-) Transcript_18739:69-761(-)
MVVHLHNPPLEIGHCTLLEGLHHRCCRHPVAADERAAALKGVLKVALVIRGHASGAEGRQVTQSWVARENGKLPAVRLGDILGRKPHPHPGGPEVVVAKALGLLAEAIESVHEVLEVRARDLGQVAEGKLQLGDNERRESLDMIADALAHAHVSDVLHVLLELLLTPVEGLFYALQHRRHLWQVILQEARRLSLALGRVNSVRAPAQSRGLLRKQRAEQQRAGNKGAGHV